MSSHNICFLWKNKQNIYLLSTWSYTDFFFFFWGGGGSFKTETMLQEKNTYFVF